MPALKLPLALQSWGLRPNRCPFSLQSHNLTNKLPPPLGTPPQVFVKCTGYLLGEHGHLLSAAGEVPLLDQFRLLQERFLAASPDTKVGRGTGSRTRGRACSEGRACAAQYREHSLFPRKGAGGTPPQA